MASGSEPTRDYLDITARVLLMPVLLGQAVHVRANYIELPEPTGLRSGTIGCGPPLRLLIIGDSSALGIGVTTQSDALLGQLTSRLRDHATISYDLVAKTGAKTADVLTWVDDLPGESYDVVVTALGVNDVTKGVSLRKWLRQQTELVDRLMSQLRQPKVILSGLPPVGQFPLLPHPLRWVLGRQAARFDRYLHALAAQRADCVALQFDMGLDESNMSADGFHPGPAVYARWAEEVAQIVLADPDLLDADKDAP
ncbi:SGNH/GDSL hydrolase family protein [Roseobacter sp. CCS2]|uniref:SGNH/GDSL hydrolase family protein n=1 Tax=Roseobacter sp. CCS2 TaxID=391593 RepID=UPI0000F40173|nr:SGNH/GDSL hydrolase family protein [Roseobacter sp. CCS2]EBA13340.1 GDSL-like Lipase/Acylhydrolase domain protein [Roseobacter sp. CCS2]